MSLYDVIVPVVSIISLAFVIWLAWDVLRRDTGTQQMLEVHRLINEGRGRLPAAAVHDHRHPGRRHGRRDRAVDRFV